MDVATLMVKIGGDDSGAREVMERSNKAVKESGGFFKDALKNAFNLASGLALFSAGAGAVHLVTDQLGGLVEAGKEANLIDAQLTAGLQSTHDASGQTTQSLNALADKLSGMTGITDSAVKSGEAMLLTFTGIGKDTFPQATQAVADMATKMNGGAIPSAQQMQQQALLLGKALNDPLKGISALTREGVTFTDQQKQQIAALEKSGNVAGAQKIILAELNREFGGSAEAAGKANGGMAILSAQMGNMKEKIGQALIPILSQLMQAIAPIVTQFADALPSILPIVTGLLTNVFTIGKQVADVFAKNLKPALDAIFGGFQDAAKGVKGVDLAGVIGPILKLAAALSKDLAGALANVMPIALQLGNIFVNDVLPILGQAWNIIQSDVIPILGMLAGIFIANVIPAIGSVAQWVDEHLMPAIKKFADFIKTSVVPIVKVLVETFVKDILPTIEKVSSVFTDKLLPPLENIAKKILPILIPLIQAVGWIYSNIWGPALELVYNGLAGIATAISDVITWIGNLLGWFGNVGSSIGTLLGHFGDITSTLNGAVTAAINGIGTAFSTVFGGLWDVVKVPINLIIGGINTLIKGLDSIQISIPSWSPIAGGKKFGIDIPTIPTLATGGDISGPFIGGEAGAELLVTPGLYRAPAGSHVYNARETQQMLAGMSRPNVTNNTYIYPQQAILDTRELARIQRRRDILAGVQ